MRSLLPAKILLLLAVLTGCSSQSSSDKIAHELQTVQSWVATAQMVGDAWMQGAVPTPYAKQTLQTARQELRKEADTLAKKAPTQQGTMLTVHIKNQEQIIDRMSSAIAQKDRSAIAKQIKQLSIEDRAISTFVKSAGGQR